MHGIEDVVRGGMCVGCGACAVRTDGRISLELGRRRSWEADLADVVEPDLRAASRVCPFSDEARNEDQLGASRFPGLPHDPRVGRYSGLFAGRLVDEARLLGASSGGLTGWVAEQLLVRGDVDAVIHVATSEDPAKGLFAYRVTDEPATYRSRRKSLYYATTFADVLAGVRGDGRRYAVLGVPCFLKAARLLAEEDEVLGSQLAFFLGLVCGHLKSQAFAEALAWQAGVAPDELATVDFRVKVPGRSSSRYDFGAVPVDGAEVDAPVAGLVGGSWGHAMFQVQACDYCDDIFAETADIAFGDAWLPRYKEDWRGMNVIVSRRPELDALLRESAELVLDELTLDEVAATQAGNFRHRRVGLSVRLHDDVAAGRPVPVKRVPASLEGVDRTRVRLVRQRRLISRRSHEAFADARAAGDLDVFLRAMRPLVATYARIDRGGPLRRFARRVQRRVAGLAPKRG
ncbi:Coenzyme F420 hydrogenase/dehydrogenase, beta subunit C-terminal domain [Agromyces sp. MMS24-JH15]|uniref:Coenzyme F420 hydrogenase/dehydrogenase, beta subunit C-terminal domain n=1 Tax=Agromyces sp. MMS24-JH15 TaxID=3243765 RepID=UPI0037484245